ncbi:hypothetical protein M0R89_18885 (plasmid) [Halorussus limi]|uniref:Uncharacterized protein n=1 Tax=Halorussus limi TaxID=2938695 RepID=A0A8U0I006_9EURY|nr:hypothetical protein [Halorussus limi]UPV76600.1 hypothetical protein M0R89_18885 [Halorussus limi]
MSDNPYTDDEYDSTYKDVHGDEPTRDQYTDETTDDTFFPSGVGNSLYPSGWGIWPAGDANDASTENEAGDDYDRRTADYDDSEGDDDGWFGEGIAGTLLLIGAVLFFFPEPSTSAIGIGLMALGVLTWVVDALA